MFVMRDGCQVSRMVADAIDFIKMFVQYRYDFAIDAPVVDNPRLPRVTSRSLSTSTAPYRKG
jgi:hypothetical protein